jgi:hypothetical protein
MIIMAAEFRGERAAVPISDEGYVQVSSLRQLGMIK